jgi:outer membrane protein assembly factor BamB
MANNNNTSSPVSPAVIRDRTLYFATGDGLHALDTLTGKKKWLFETWQATYFDRKHAAEGPVLGDGVIFLSMWVHPDPNTQESFLFAVDPESGKAKWVTHVPGWDATVPATAKGLAFLAVEDPGPTPTSFSGRETLYAINAADGQIKWKASAGRKYGTQLLIAGDTIYFFTDTNLLALELGTGRQLWSFSAEEISEIRADDQRLYVATHKGSIMRPKDTLHALALTTGQENWSQDLGGSAGIAAIQDGVVYAGRGHLHAIEAATGKELWSFKGEGRESARLISEGRVFLTSPTMDYIGSKRIDQGYLCAIDAKTGKLKP